MASHEHLHVPHICYQSSINCNFETGSNSFVLAREHSAKPYLATPMARTLTMNGLWQFVISLNRSIACFTTLYF